MPPGKRGPGRGRPKIGTSPSANGAALFRRKKDVPEVRKAQSTLVNFFTTPKTKPSDQMPSSTSGTTKSRGSQGVIEIDDGPTNCSKEDVELLDSHHAHHHYQKNSKLTDVTDSNGASSNAAGDGSPSTAAKAVRFKLTSNEDVETRGTAPRKEKSPEKSSFPARGMKRSRQGTDTESEAEAEPAVETAASEDANDIDDEDVIMSQPSSSPISDVSGSSARKTCTPPPRVQRTHPKVPESPAMTTAVSNPSCTSEIGSLAGDCEGATGRDGKEGFVTPARTPPSFGVAGKTTASMPLPDAASKEPSDVLSPLSSQQQELQRELSETQDVSTQKEHDRRKSKGEEEQAEPARSSPRSTPKTGKTKSSGIKAGGKKGRPKKEAAEATSPVPSSPPPQTQTQSSVPHPNLAKYLEQLAAVIKNADLVDSEDRRQDRQLGLEDAAKIAVAWKAVGACGVDEKGGDGERLAPSPAIVDATFPEHLSPLLARVVQGSPSPLSELAEETLDVMKSLVPEMALELSTSQVTSKISLVAQRKCYGFQSKKAVIPEDTSPESLWRWEVQLMDLLPADKASLVRQVRSDRANVGKLVKALARLTEVMTKCPTDAAKISKEEEKVMAFARKEEVLRRKASLKEIEVARKEQAKREKEEARDEERKAKEEERRKKLELKNQEKNAKAEKKRLKAQQQAAAEEERKKQEEAKAKNGTVSLFNFFKATDPTPQDSKENTAPFAMGVSSGGSIIGGSLRCASSAGDLKLSQATACGGRNALVNGSCIGVGGGGLDVGGGGGAEGRKSEGGFDAVELEMFERRLKEGGELEELLGKTAKDRTERLRKRKARIAFQEECEVQIVKPKRIKVTVTVQVGGGGFGEPAYSEAKEVEVRNRMKLLQFHQDYRPPYWGTWSKTSREVTGRRPLGRDSKGLVNYDYDSEADWEEEAQGEDLLSDEEGDKEPEDNLDYKDGWLRQDDEFSDEEIDRFDVDGKCNQTGNGTDAGASSTPSHDEDSHANKKLSNGAVVIGVGEGVSLGAGAAAAVAAGNAKGNRGGLQQAFVASLMFRREAIPEEEARENPALRALSAYRAVAFPFGDGSAGGEGGRFPVAVVDALVEKPRRKDTGDGDGGYGSGGDGKDDKGKQKTRKFKDVPDEILASLVEMLHGKTTKREEVVNSFVALHPQCTKKAVYQKVKDVSTRERSIRGGTVFVVRQDVMERLGVEPTSTVELKPSPAEIAAAAAASAQEAGVDGEGSGGAVSTPPRNGKNAKGNSEDKGKLLPPPGQLSLLGFLHTAKGASAGESSPPSRATPKVLFGPSGAAEAAAAARAETSKANETGEGHSAGEEEDQANKKEKADSAEKGDGNAKPDRSDDKKEEAPAWRAPGPDESGGWEEWKESEPLMDKPVPICNVLTPSKKVRRLAAARPVLYLGSGTPPPRPVIFDDDDDDEDKTPKTAGDTQSTAISTLASKEGDKAGGVDGTVVAAGSGLPESGGEDSVVAC